MRPIRHRGIFAVVIAYAVLCTALVLSRPIGLHWSPDCFAKFLAVRSIRFEHGLRYDIPYLGRGIDPGLEAIPIGESFYDVRNGEIHMSWPELFPILVFPFFRTLGFYGLFVVPVVSGCIGVYLSGRIAELLRRRSGWLAALLTAFATPVLFYGALYWEHTPALALMLLATFLCVRYVGDGIVRQVVFAGACVGVASAGLRTDANLFFAAMVASLFFITRGIERIKISAIAVGGFLLGALPAALLNWTTNGKFLAANTAKNTPPPSLSYLKQAGLGVLTHFFAGKPVPATFAWMVVLGAAATIAAHYLPTRWRMSLVLPSAIVLAMGSWLCLKDAYLTNAQSFYGHLAMSPFVAIAYMLPHEKQSYSRGVAFLVIAASVYTLLNLTALTLAYPYGWAADGNLEWGPRYWLPLFPLLVIPAVVNFEAIATKLASVWRRLFMVSAAVLVLLSVAFEVQGLRQCDHLIRSVTGHRQALIDLGDTPLVTDMFFTSAVSGEQFFARPSYYIAFTTPEVFTDWISRAASRGLTRFDLASYGAIVGHPFLFYPVAGWKLTILGVEDRGDLHIGHIQAVRIAEP